MHQRRGQRNDHHDGDVLPKRQSGVPLLEQVHDQMDDEGRPYAVGQQADQQRADTDQKSEDHTLHFLPGSSAASSLERTSTLPSSVLVLTMVTPLQGPGP